MKTEGGYNSSTLRKSTGNEFQRGSNSVQGISALSWKIDPGHKYLILTLIREDDVVLDRYTIPLKP